MVCYSFLYYIIYRLITCHYIFIFTCNPKLWHIFELDILQNDFIFLFDITYPFYIFLMCFYLFFLNKFQLYLNSFHATTWLHSGMHDHSLGCNLWSLVPHFYRWNLLTEAKWVVMLFHVDFSTVMNSLLFLHFVGGSEIIKELAVHLHERFQHIVNKRDDRPKKDNRGMSNRPMQKQS